MQQILQWLVPVLGLLVLVAPFVLAGSSVFKWVVAALGAAILIIGVLALGVFKSKDKTEGGSPPSPFAH